MDQHPTKQNGPPLPQKRGVYQQNDGFYQLFPAKTGVLAGKMGM
jgi:hypothetical protein